MSSDIEMINRCSKVSSAVPLAEDDDSDIDDHEETRSSSVWESTTPGGSSDTNNNEESHLEMTLKEKENDCKVLVIGATNSGKTSLIEKYLTGKNSEAKTTFGVDISKATLPFKSSGQSISCNVNFLFVDMAGMRKFQAHNSTYYSNVFAALFVFDVTCKLSLNFTINWLEDYSNFCKRANFSPPLKLLICNKSDLPNPAMNRVQITEFAQESGMTSVFECSAKSGRNIDSIFSHIAEQFAKIRLHDCNSA